MKNEGVPALYSGLSAALARQASYTTLRLGLYDLMKRLVIDGEILNMQLIFQGSARPETAGYWNEGLICSMCELAINSPFSRPVALLRPYLLQICWNGDPTNWMLCTPPIWSRGLLRALTSLSSPRYLPLVLKREFDLFDVVVNHPLLSRPLARAVVYIFSKIFRYCNGGMICQIAPVVSWLPSNTTRVDIEDLNLYIWSTSLK